MRKLLLFPLLFVCLVAAQTPRPTAPPQDPPPDPRLLLRSGPMLGYSELTETVIWVQTRRPARAQVRFWKQGAPGTARVTPEIATAAAGDHIARFLISELDFGGSTTGPAILLGYRDACAQLEEFLAYAPEARFGRGFSGAISANHPQPPGRARAASRPCPSRHRAAAESWRRRRR